MTAPAPVSMGVKIPPFWGNEISPPLIRGHVYRLKRSLEKDPLGPMDGTVTVSKARIQKIFITSKKTRKQPFLATHHLFERFLKDQGYLLPE